MSSLFPDPGRRHSWGKLDYKLSARKDCSGNRLKLITALLFIADGHESVVATREQIRAQSGLSLRSYFDGMKWLRDLGAITERPEHAAKSGRRIVLEWVRDPNFEPTTHESDLDDSARLVSAPTMSAPTMSAPTMMRGARSQCARPYLIGEIREINTVPSVCGESLTHTGACETGEQTDGTVLASLATEIEERETRCQEILAKVDGDESKLDRANHRAARLEYRVAKVELDQLRAGDRTCITPRPTPPPRPASTPGLPPATPAVPPRVAPDDSITQAEVLAALAAAKLRGPDAAKQFARLLATRHRDGQSLTLDTFERAALRCGREWIEQQIVQVENDPNVRNPARVLSKRFGRELRTKR